MRRILVTAISGNVSNGILQNLCDGDDIIFGCDIYDYPVGMDKVTNFWKSDLAVNECYIENLLKKCEEYHITHLIPVNEIEIEKISQNRSLFEEKNIKLLIQTESIIDIFLDKKKTIEFLEPFIEKNLPRLYEKDKIIDGFDYLIKLRKSCGSKFVKVISSRGELDQLNLQDGTYVIQEYLENAQEEYTVGVFSNGDVINTIIFRRKLEHGYTSFVELAQSQQIEELAEKVAKVLNLNGFLNIQLRKAGDTYKIFEINPRISGTVRFRYLLGFDDVNWWLDLLDGKTQQEYVQKYKKAIGMRELREKFVVLE